MPGKRYLGLLLLAAAGITGLFSFDEYGLGWDEETQRKTGMVSYDYVFSGSDDLPTWKDRDYGVAFELPLIILEKAFGLKDSRSIYLTRHLLTHSFFLISAFFGFLLIDLLYKNKLLATIGFLLVVLHPRLYGHSFINTKDIPFMSMFMFCLYLNALAFSKRNLSCFVALGVGVGLLVNLRIMGVLLLCCVVFFLAVDFLREKGYRHTLMPGAFFLVTALVTLYASWPFLWKDPINNFVFAFENMSKFRWDSSVLFKGQTIEATQLSWEYIPTWFFITTPIFYLISGLFGTALLVFRLFAQPGLYLSNSPERNNLFFLICCFVPVTVVVLLGSVLYDGWRQVYFIYPSFVMLAVYGLDFLLKKNMGRPLSIISFVAFAAVGYNMVRDYPLQHVYFNRLVSTGTPEELRKRFELDYWGVSYSQLLEYILENDISPVIRVKAANSPGRKSLLILPADERGRIHIVKSLKSADYFITNYREHPQDYRKLRGQEWYSLKMYNSSVGTVFKLR